MAQQPPKPQAAPAAAPQPKQESTICKRAVGHDRTCGGLIVIEDVPHKGRRCMVCQHFFPAS